MAGEFFSTISRIGIAVLSAYTAGAASPLYGAAVGLAGNAAIGAYDARRTKRQIEQNKKQRDLTITLPTAPRRRVYGVDRVPGVLRYWTTHGPENRFLSMVYVFADHPCHAFYDIQFDDKSIGELDVNGYVQLGSPWYKSRVLATSQNLAAVSGSITLPTASAGMPSIAIAGASFPGYVPQVSTNDSGFVDLTPGVHFTHSVGGTVITLIGALTGASIDAGSLVVNYTIQSGRPLARVRRYLGAVPQTADATLITDSAGEWTSTCRLDNQCYAIVTLEWDESVAANGVPVVHAVLAGAKVYDPRSGLTAWSDNWALCIRDYLKHASGCADSEIDDATVTESANKSAELVTVDDGTVGRYTINGSIESTTDPIDALTDMALAGGGTVAWSAGKFRVLAGMYRNPVSITLNDSHLAGPIKYQGEVSREDRFNTVIGAFRDARSVGGAVPYTRTDYSAYKSTAYVAEDNGATIERRIDFDFITDYRVAHRVAKQILRRARQGARLTATWSLRALPLQVGDVVTVTLTRYGISAKPFEVVSTQHNYPDTVTTVLQETDPSCYDWNFSEVAFLDPAPNTLLPSPTDVAMPLLSVLCTADEPATIKTLTDGSQIPYARVSWPARTNAAEYVEIRWKRSFETAYRTLRARIGETFLDIEGISGGDVLQIVGTAVNGIGARSDQWIITSLQVDARLPRYNGAAPALSANLLKNAAQEYTVGELVVGAVGFDASLASVVKRTDEGYVVRGVPSSLLLQVADNTSSGVGKAAFVDWPAVAIDPTRDTRFVVFAGLIGWNTDGVVQVLWRDASDGIIRVDSGNVVTGVVEQSSARRWDRPDHYQTSGAFVVPPSNARSAVVRAVAGGNWLSGGTGKYLSFFRPFFGVAPEGSTEYPPFDVGGQNVVDTPLIAPDATSLVIVDRKPPAIIAWSGGTQGQPNLTLPSVEIPASTDIPEGAKLRVHVSGSLSITGKPGVGSLTDVGVVLAIYDQVLNASGAWSELVIGATNPTDDPAFVAGTTYRGSLTPAAMVIDTHFSSARDMAGVTLTGSMSHSQTFYWVRGYGRRFSLEVQFDSRIFPFPNSTNWTASIATPARVTVEVLKV